MQISSLVVGVVVLLLQSTFAVTFFPVIGIEFAFVLLMSFYRINSPAILFLLGLAADILFFRSFGTSFLLYILAFYAHTAFLKFINTRSMLTDFFYTSISWIILIIGILVVKDSIVLGTLSFSFSIQIVLTSFVSYLFIAIGMWALKNNQNDKN